MPEFKDDSYLKHARLFEDHASGSTKAKHAATWLNHDTVDAWLHSRLYASLDPLLRTDVGAEWITVGDGRFGKDARYLIDNGANATASDIAETLLKEACESGYIPRYCVENAESLSFNDASFDYAFCKDAYHHFPRPMLALYEMLRVARKGVCLIEPNDLYVGSNPVIRAFATAKNLVKRLLGRPQGKHNFEEVGNYVYTLSRREIEKVALGINLRLVAIKGSNTAYFGGVEYEEHAKKGPLYRKAKLMIFLQDFLCRLRLGDYGLITAIIFKELPSTKTQKELRRSGYKLIELPVNPYASTNEH